MTKPITAEDITARAYGIITAVNNARPSRPSPSLAAALQQAREELAKEPEPAREPSPVAQERSAPKKVTHAETK